MQWASVRCLVIPHICLNLITPTYIQDSFYTIYLLQPASLWELKMEQLEQVYKVMDSALEQYRLDKSDLNFGRAQGAAKLALELSIITADQFVVYVESLIWERNNA